MKIKELLSYLNSDFPSFLQESFDNTGNQIVFPEEDLTGIYICLDPDRFIIDDALSFNCNLIISHHPMIFKPLKSIVHGDVKSSNIISLISKSISLFSMHTNFDKIMYSHLADVLGFANTSVLIQTDIYDDKPLGIGSFAELGEALEFRMMLDRVKEKLDLEFLLYAGSETNQIETIAFINGSGGSSIEKVIKSHNPDCIITGDVGYHHIKSAIEYNKCVIDAGHFGTEKIFRKLMSELVKKYVNKAGTSITVIESEIEQNPFKVY
jgi:dinuclear metal center YbgI/SA1388 family protein